MASFGTFGLADTLAQQTPVVAFGEDNAFAAIEAALEAHNRVYADMASDLMDMTTDQLRRYGGPSSMVMLPADEYARIDAQKITAGANVGFPMQPFQISLQWTKWAIEKMRLSELDAQFTAAQDSDVKNLQLQLKTAIFTPTDSTWTDKYGSGLLLPVKAFLNADGQPIPVGPNGEVFNASTHTHYLGVTTGGAPTVGEFTGAIETVIEHYATGQPYGFINRAQETLVRAFAGFAAYYDNRVTAATTITRGDAALNPIALYNRPIGILDGAEIWTKPWVPAGYAFFHLGGGAPKPMLMREEANAPTGLRMMADNEMFPLRANTMQRTFGVGVWNRPNGAILDMTTGGGTYTLPAITVV